MFGCLMLGMYRNILITPGDTRRSVYCDVITKFGRLQSSHLARACPVLTTSTMLTTVFSRTGRLLARPALPWRGFTSSAPRLNSGAVLHRSTELGAVEETQDIATMDKLLKEFRTIAYNHSSAS